jgi:hypothetical protein
MSFWFNNFIEFEKKQKEDNNLIINLYYSNEGENRNVKVFVPAYVSVPTNFLIKKRAKELRESLSNEEDFKGFEISYGNFGKYATLEINVPNNHELINSLPKEFQKGNYDKLLKFNRFYPERKVVLDEDLESLLLNQESIHLENFEKIKFKDFLSAKEMENLPWVVLDIEKPL